MLFIAVMQDLRHVTSEDMMLIQFPFLEAQSANRMGPTVVRSTLAVPPPGIWQRWEICEKMNTHGQAGSKKLFCHSPRLPNDKYAIPSKSSCPKDLRTSYWGLTLGGPCHLHSLCGPMNSWGTHSYHTQSISYSTETYFHS